MNKIKAFVIHALGGKTNTEVALDYVSQDTFEQVRNEAFLLGQDNVLNTLMGVAKSLYGESADKWCKDMYGWISDMAHDVKVREAELDAQKNRINTKVGN